LRIHLNLNFRHLKKVRIMKLKKTTTDTIGAFLGSNSEFEGGLTFQGTIRIDGRYKGNISVDGTLIAGPTGKVEAEINASKMIINGEVTGNMTAEKNIEVHASGKVYGNLVARTVTIHEGAVFQGHCHSGEKQDNQQEKLALLLTVQKNNSPTEQKETAASATKSA